MRWYEYKMEADDLAAPDDLKAKLLAMTSQLTEEEKNQPMMQAAAPAQPAPEKKKKGKLIHFPRKQVGMLAACLAVCVVGYGAFATGQIGLGAKSSSPAAYYSADSTAAVMAAGGVDRAAVDSPMAADYSLDTMALESSADNGTAVFRRTTRRQRPTAPTAPVRRSSIPRTSASKARTTTRPAPRWTLPCRRLAAIWSPAASTRAPTTAAASA